MTSMFNIYLTISLLFITESYGNTLDLSLLRYSYVEEVDTKFIKFDIDSKDWQIKVICKTCEILKDGTVKCKSKESIKVGVELKKEDITFVVPYNISCAEQNSDIARDLTASSTTDAIELSWTKSDIFINTYIISYFENNNYSYKIITTDDLRYQLKPLKEKTSYRVCLAALNKRYTTGKYGCIDVRTDFSETGPVTDIRVTSSSAFAEVIWKKPIYEEDNPLGYVVSYFQSNDRCWDIIIHMKNNLNIKDVGSCTLIGEQRWKSLQTLKIPNLRPYTKYYMTIYPFNGNKIKNKVESNFMTAEGESGPVSHIEQSIQDTWLLIKYQKPSQENGVVIKYKIELILQKLGICKSSGLIIYTKSDIYKLFDYILLVNELTRCAEYRVNVFPINRWGIGQGANITFKYKTENTVSILNLEAKFISVNFISISWIVPSTKEDCAEISYVVKVESKYNKTDCRNLLINKQTCTAFDKMISKNSLCAAIDEISSEKIGQSSIIYYGGDFTSEVYEISVSQITFSSFKQGDTLTIHKLKEDCFTDCYSSDYKGIRTEDNCIKWKDSIHRKKYSQANNNFCSMPYAVTPWCLTVDNWKHCNIPKCSKIKKSSGCVKDISHTINSTRIELSWISPVFQGSVIGFITLLYNADNICEKSHIQLCESCPSETQLQSQIKNFYTFCKLTVTKKISNKSTLDNLRNDEKYIIYIIPLLSAAQAGEVKKLGYRTLLSKPGTPQNVKVTIRNTTSLSFSWDKLLKSSDEGLPDLYEAFLFELTKEETLKRSYSEHVDFANLKMCTQFCLKVHALNKAGSSKKSEITCSYTYAPKLGYATVNHIEDGPLLYRDISWGYSSRDHCQKLFRVLYQDRFFNISKTKETNSTKITIKKLKRNTFYIVKVRAESQLETLNTFKEGKYSDEVKFYTGKAKPNITHYNTDIFSYGKKINVSWSIDNFSDGSIFQFIVILRNSSDHCINFVNLVCKDCPYPYRLENINDYEKIKRTKILKCKNNQSYYIKEYSKDNVTISYVFSTTSPLNNFSVAIYAINLVGVHHVYGQKSVYKTEEKTNVALISLVSLILLFIILLIVLCVTLKVKKKPLFIYQTIYNTKNPQTETGNRNSRLTEKELRLSNNSSTKKTTNNSGKYNSALSNENVPLLEPKIRSIGVALKEFHTYYQKMSENQNDLVIQEYKRLTAECRKMEHDLGFTVDVGKLPSNAKKNRFINILPFDQNRVHILDRSANNDYINANYVPFMNDETKNEYIASQGPIDDSIDDFWQMISDQNINCIIMLTRITEDNKFKCLQYWPESVGGEQTYGNNGHIVVSLENEIESESHIERQLLMKDEKANVERKVVQLHMHTWTDHSAPNLEYFDKLLFRFHEIANSSATNPYLIHCSAGVGRTGTLICIDRLIKQLVGGCQQINIYDTVFTLRHYRNFMVQRQAQYVFIHDYIEHFLNKYMKMDDTDDMLYFNDD